MARDISLLWTNYIQKYELHLSQPTLRTQTVSIGSADVTEALAMLVINE